MATEWEEEFDIEVEFPKFLGEVEDRTETIYETFDTEAVVTQTEALDQTISLLRSMNVATLTRGTRKISIPSLVP